MAKFSYSKATFELWLTLSPFILAVSLLLAISLLSSCAQINNTYYVQGDANRITATDNVNKSTKDLMDLAGSAYGEATTSQGAKP